MFRTLLYLIITQATIGEIGASSGCTDGILIVGGKTSAGPSKYINLLSREQGWCQNSGFPELPEPLLSPGAFFLRGFLFVCGFSGDFSCKYTERGWIGWEDVHSIKNQADFKMVFSNLVGSVMMISEELDSKNNHTYHLQHNPTQGTPAGIISWMEMVGSPFDQHKDFSSSCFSSLQGDLVITGGYDISSLKSVSKWSSKGSELESGPPAFQEGVVPDMMEARQAHGCAEFDGQLVASGGFCTTKFQVHRSAEYFDGFNWNFIPSMGVQRAHFGLESMCGMLVALGGYKKEDFSSDEELMSSVEAALSVESAWLEQEWMELPEGRA